MKQILQSMRDGETSIVHAPAPIASRGHVIVRTTRSLISAGTERMLVDFGKASWVDKARQQPEKVRMVLNKMRTDGVLTTLEAVQSKLSEPLPLGYCNVGVIAEVGDGVEYLRKGDRVVSNGPHADLVRVPRNLCARIPDAVDDDSAAFVVLASIGLQGIRLAAPTLGEAFVVMGVGLIGLLTVQLLRAHGCRVLAIDYDSGKLAIARRFGAQTCDLSQGDDPVAAGLEFSRGHGVDGVIVTASTSSSDPMSQAAKMSRKRGRIVLVGVTGLELNRSDFYEKELTFQVSCSYGPGRYDKRYEAQGHDYPFGFVRWTEQRNFEAVLDMLACGALDVQPLISHRFSFEDAVGAYEVLSSNREALGILIEYRSPVAEREVRSVRLRPDNEPATTPGGEAIIGFIGAGNYAARVLVPAFRKCRANLHTIATTGGTASAVQGGRAGFIQATTDVDALLARADTNCVVIATRHDSHARLVAQSLAAGKHVFVEKPLAVNDEQLEEVRVAFRAARESNPNVQLMLGFNRRFAPHVVRMKALLAGVKAPKSFLMTVNAGSIPVDHWTQDSIVGGGRIVGEACHFIDLMRFLAGGPVISVQSRCMNGSPDGIGEDKASITLGFADGSFGTIMYLANGSNAFPKERIEVFAGGKVLQLDNFRCLTGFGWPAFGKERLWKQDKGQNACVQAFLNAIRSGVPAIPEDEIFEVAQITNQVAAQLRNQKNP
jgi:predicted dehydrogenase/threonine dehydrogenase-like Zn-dependent dehydrogenase